MRVCVDVDRSDLMYMRLYICIHMRNCIIYVIFCFGINWVNIFFSFRECVKSVRQMMVHLCQITMRLFPLFGEPLNKVPASDMWSRLVCCCKWLKEIDSLSPKDVEKKCTIIMLKFDYIICNFDYMKFW